jgi:hypothetical protein
MSAAISDNCASCHHPIGWHGAPRCARVTAGPRGGIAECGCSQFVFTTVLRCDGCGRNVTRYYSSSETPPDHRATCRACVATARAAELCVRVASPHDVHTTSVFTTEPGVTRVAG